jgi:hypothetical protein
MKKLFVVTLLAGLSLMSPVSYAGQFEDARQKIISVRSSMLDLLMNKDKRGAQELKAADDISAAAKSALAGLKSPAGKEAKFGEFKKVATAFLATRDGELRSALVAGNDGEVKRLLAEVQKPRVEKLTELTKELDK